MTVTELVAWDSKPEPMCNLTPVKYKDNFLGQGVTWYSDEADQAHLHTIFCS